MLTGRLDADAIVDGPSVLLRLAVTHAGIGACACPVPVEGRVLVAVAGDLAASQVGQWRAGRTIRLPATVRRPVTARNLGAPDAAHDLVRRRLALTSSVKSALQVESLGLGTWIEEAAAAIRARARRAIARAAGAEAPEAAAIGTAVLIGDRAGLTPDLTARLQRAGTFHVIAISGGNIALLSLITLWTVGWLCGGGRVTAVVTAVVLVAYAVVVGGGASVLRATGMAVVGLAARTIDQRGMALNVLALTGAALLVADPLLAVDTGFWLTTAATAGLVVGLGDRDDDRTRWRRVVRALVLASVWAELALLPIVAAAFQQVTVAGVLLSALAIPGMAVAQLSAMAAVAVDLVVPGLLPVAGFALRAGATVVTESARVVDLLPFLSWRVPPPHAAAVVAYYAALALWLWARVPGQGALRVRLHPAALGGLVTAALWIAAAPATLVAWRQPFLDLTVLDVGQGDAVVLRFPDGTTMLVDAGGRPGGSRFDVGARVVGPALRARGIRRLDYLVVTHADADHIGGAVSIVEEFRPAEVWTGVPVEAEAATAALRQAAAAAGVAWREVQRGDRVAFGDAEVAGTAPAACRLGASACAQRRLGGAGGVARDDSGAAHGRCHRGGRSGDCRRSGAGVGASGAAAAATHRAQGRASRQRRLDHRGVPAGHDGGDRAGERRRRRPVRPSRAGDTGAARRRRRRRVADRSRRGSDAVDRRPRGVGARVQRPAASVDAGAASALTRSHSAFCASSGNAASAVPSARAICSMRVKRPWNLVLAARNAASGSTPSLRAKLAMANSRSPTSSSTADRATPLSTAARTSRTSSSILSSTSAGRVQSKPTAAARAVSS